MGKIEEVEDDVVEENDGNKKQKFDKEEKQVNGDECESDDDEDEDDEEIDFTKSVSKEELLESISSPIEELQAHHSCCEESDHTEMEEEEEDYIETKKPPAKPENLSSKRVVAFIVLFPMIASGLFMMNEVVGNFKIGKSTMQATAAIGGALIALFIMSNVKALQSAVKFVLCFAWVILLYPTYQVYHCSPVPLKNDMLGTWFSLKTPASKFSDLSFTTSECFRSFQIQAPYMMSAMTVKITLVVDIKDLINLNAAEANKKESDDDVETDKSNLPAAELNYFLLVSKRSVKKKFHKLYMIVESDDEMSKTLRNALKLTGGEKEKNLLQVTGVVHDVDESLEPLKKELEGYGYFMRPIKFKAYSVKYVDRYAKLKNYNYNYS